MLRTPNLRAVAVLVMLVLLHPVLVRSVDSNYNCWLISDMSENPPERIDSDLIRQGLLSIRNSQLELLNELKT
jgi:hypothetical protein